MNTNGVVFSKEALDNLNKLRDKIILFSIKKRTQQLFYDPHLGIPIQKKLIPLHYQRKYSCKILFKINLPKGWRLLYTFTIDDNKQILILEILDHKSYERRFKY